VQLNYWGWSWPLRPEDCACDIHFVEYLRREVIHDKVIFHFGTGAHHLVGKTNLDIEPPNEILAITASPEEYQRYVEFVIANPRAAKTYKVLFGDVYTLSPRILPWFDVVTLFHLCEFYEETTSTYADLNDSSLLALFLSRLRPGGRILFYSRSSHFSQCRTIIDEFVAAGLLVQVDEHETLIVYGRPPTCAGRAANRRAHAAGQDAEGATATLQLTDRGKDTSFVPEHRYQ
jgi:hypothetical protein